MHFQIITINHDERWIYLTSNTDDSEPDAFITLLNRIATQLNGDIISVGDWQYRISTDELRLKYQWDDLFGIVIIYRKGQLEKAVEFINKYITYETDSLNFIR